MRFIYEYRTRENKRETGVICASDREAVFRILKEKGIRPGSVTEAPGFFNKLFGKGKRWIAIILLGLIVLALSIRVVRQGDLVDAYGESNLISERSQIYGDTWILKSISANRWSEVFSDEGDMFLACHAIPGRDCGCSKLDAVVLKRIAVALTNDMDRVCFTEADDLAEVAEIKRMVNGMRLEFRTYILDGGTVEKYMSRLDIRQRAEMGILKRERERLYKTEDEDVWKKSNIMLRNMGLPMVSPPE